MTSFTIKNIPDDLYKSLKKRAKTNMRSINSEILICIEEVISGTKETSSTYLERIRELRQTVKFAVAEKEITSLKRKGRP